VEEYRQPLWPSMRLIQEAIVEVMGACLAEIRKSNKIDTSDLTLENGLFKSFDRIVSNQLDPIWHTVSKRLKQFVFDLRTLRQLTEYLLRYDAVTFLRYLEMLRTHTESVHSFWLCTDAASALFEAAKRRVYTVRKAEPPLRYVSSSSLIQLDPRGNLLAET
jgi:DNA excision repair protein ERCC-4